jgi:hypothetical protein
MRRLGGWPSPPRPAVELSPCSLGGSFLSLLPLRSCGLGLHHPSLGGGFDGEATPLVWATGWGQNSGSCVTPGVVWGGIYWGRRAFGLSPLIACKSPSHWAVIHCCLGTLYCTAFFPEALRSCPRPLPFPCHWGPHSLIAGALGHSPLPLGCSAGPAVPPLQSVWRFC